MSTYYYPREYLVLTCLAEREATPHSTGRIIDCDDQGISLQVKCGKCGSLSIHRIEHLPEGYKVYNLRITGEDGPHLPAELRPLPYLEESFSIVATSLQDAHERATFLHSLQFTGHLTHFYINGELHLDERF